MCEGEEGNREGETERRRESERDRERYRNAYMQTHTDGERGEGKGIAREDAGVFCPPRTEIGK